MPLPPFTVLYRPLPSSTALCSIQNHPCPLQRDQPTPDHLVQVGQDRLDRLFGLHDLDDERQIERQPQDLVGVHHARRPEPGHPPQHGRAREPPGAQLLEQRFVQRLAVILIALADEDAHEGAFALEAMRHGASRHSSLLASAVPVITAARQPTMVPPMYNPAYQYSPSPSSRMLS